MDGKQYSLPQNVVRVAPPSGTQLSKQHTRQQLQTIIGGLNEVLVTATTVFPFHLFPDSVTVDREKFTVTHRVFFGVAEVVSLRIEDILNVTADVGPFFGSLKVSTRFYDTTNDRKPYVVSYLWRSDALKIKRILQGYVIATQKGIDCSALKTEELAVMLDKLGEGAPFEEI